jgi:hypothetical protein
LPDYNDKGLAFDHCNADMVPKIDPNGDTFDVEKDPSGAEFSF